MTSVPERHVFLKSGDQYRESLRDGRVVFSAGQRIEDVTTHPATGGGVDMLAAIYDQQIDPATQHILTYRRADGALAPMAYLVPRTKDDLRSRRRMIEHVSRQTFGFSGRGMDMIALGHIGTMSQYPSFKKWAPELAENILAFHGYAEENNLYLAEALADPQGSRARAATQPADAPPAERVVAHITRETKDGIWLGGVKAVATAAPQAHLALIGRPFPSPRTDECFWVMLALNAPGVRMVCRESLSDAGKPIEEHPITARGEEQECLIALDNVFIPREHVFSLRNPAAHDPTFFAEMTRLQFWYALVRFTVKIELYVGLARLVVGTLGTAESVMVRDRVADIIQCAQILRGMLVAAEELAEIGEGGVIAPDTNTITAARVYGLQMLPRIYQALQDLCGQGLMVRFSKQDLDIECASGKKLSWFLDLPNATAWEKNQIMNLVWDVTSSATAARVATFEQANAQTIPMLKERLFRDYDADRLIEYCRAFLTPKHFDGA